MIHSSAAGQSNHRQHQPFQGQSILARRWLFRPNYTSYEHLLGATHRHRSCSQ